MSGKKRKKNNLYGTFRSRKKENREHAFHIAGICISCGSLSQLVHKIVRDHKKPAQIPRSRALESLKKKYSPNCGLTKHRKGQKSLSGTIYVWRFFKCQRKSQFQATAPTPPPQPPPSTPNHSQCFDYGLTIVIIV